ncbi:hypothetical protein [Variovorax sp. OV329]|uniref:hypothetical protein n=1 Tax=Variovorax sp. OV329 TaxID=1882825 RepID=UPI0008E29594|nr:hypothetical protein [Variovorax sp. OV329]SFM87352.1 hypothetical protein SAMN05444747_11082 [Variovorax sp. OV329]
MPASAPARAPHLVIPFAGRATPGCRAALAQLKLPNLERLLARLAPAQEDAQDESTLSPPHKRALAAARGLPTVDGLIPWAALEARELGLPPASPDQGWGLMTLCHWQVGIDDVALGDPEQLDISAAESAALLDALRPFFVEDGIEVYATPEPGRWLARSALLDGLATASIDRAVGHPISEWSPLTEASRPLRRLQNEMQMLLYTHAVNDARTERRVPPINSFWLSGTGVLPADFAGTVVAPEVDSRLRTPALRDDAPGWSEAWQALDAQRIAPLLADSERGAAVRLTLCGDRAAKTFVPREGGGLAAFARRLFERPPAVAEVLGAL